MIKKFFGKLLYFYSLLLILALFFWGIKSLFFGSFNEKILLFFLIFPASYFLIEIGRKLPKIKVFLSKKFFSGFLIFSKFISIPLLAIVSFFCFFHSSNFKEFLFSFSFLPVVFFFIQRIQKKSPSFLEKEDKMMVGMVINEEEIIKDAQLRQFLKALGGVSFGFLLASLLNPKKASAAFFGSIPGPGTVALKDTSGTKINPATEDGNLEYIKDNTKQIGTNNLDEASATVTYVGKEDADGTWIVQKIDTSSGTAITYATVTNNPSVTSYNDAWAARTSLTYQNYKDAF